MSGILSKSFVPICQYRNFVFFSFFGNHLQNFELSKKWKTTMMTMKWYDMTNICPYTKFYSNRSTPLSCKSLHIRQAYRHNFFFFYSCTRGTSKRYIGKKLDITTYMWENQNQNQKSKFVVHNYTTEIRNENRFSRSSCIYDTNIFIVYLTFRKNYKLDLVLIEISKMKL